ncbi:choline-sulfatase [Phaeobacter sp. C3_T13_0]|uniref:choline-sulfatase n=1 Tax=Phaeobacter cretensis TaxID=3342641 RepID=UPI0039BC9BF3
MTAPNILLIQVDQLAANALSAHGNQTVKDPNISALAEAGVVFENCYCNLPMCGPSRASMHTGRLPFSMGMYDNASEFHADQPTFCHYLRDMGYRSELSGKMHFVGPDQLHGYEKRHTTEIYPANFAWTVDWSKGREYRPTNLTMAPIIESGPAVRTMQMDYDDEVAYNGKQALYDLARKADDKPFQLTISFTSPHSPFVIGQEYWDRYDHDDIEAPSVPPLELDEMDHLSRNLHYCQARDKFTVTDERRRMARHGYYGMISYIDDKVGEIMEVLNQTGLADNTIVIFTSDHGEMMGERGMWFKQHFFEWAAHVPFIVVAPDRFKPSRVEQNISLIDLMPTLLDLASNEEFTGYVAPCDGTSLLPALNGDTSDMADMAISEFAADGSTGPSRMVKKGQWKLMWLEGHDTLLYDVTADPNELDNLAARPEHAAIEAELTEILFDGWDPDALRTEIRASQERRLAIHRVTGGAPTYVNKVRLDDDQRYIRNAGAADTKARARLPYVAPAQPDSE